MNTSTSRQGGSSASNIDSTLLNIQKHQQTPFGSSFEAMTWIMAIHEYLSSTYYETFVDVDYIKRHRPSFASLLKEIKAEKLFADDGDCSSTTEEAQRSFFLRAIIDRMKEQHAVFKVEAEKEEATIIGREEMCFVRPPPNRPSMLYTAVKCKYDHVVLHASNWEVFLPYKPDMRLILVDDTTRLFCQPTCKPVVADIQVGDQFVVNIATSLDMRDGWTKPVYVDPNDVQRLRVPEAIIWRATAITPVAPNSAHKLALITSVLDNGDDDYIVTAAVEGLTSTRRVPFNAFKFAGVPPFPGQMVVVDVSYPPEKLINAILDPPPKEDLRQSRGLMLACMRNTERYCLRMRTYVTRVVATISEEMQKQLNVGRIVFSSDMMSINPAMSVMDYVVHLFDLLRSDETPAHPWDEAIAMIDRLVASKTFKNTDQLDDVELVTPKKPGSGCNLYWLEASFIIRSGYFRMRPLLSVTYDRIPH